MTTPTPALDLDALAHAIASTLSGSRLTDFPGFRDIAAHAIGDVIEVTLDNGVQFEMRLSATTKKRKATK